MKQLIIIVLLLRISFLASSQESVLFTDSRDQEVYNIVQIGNLVWFQDNLRFNSPTSFCSTSKKPFDCKLGNFYYNSELLSVCPEGWRVPTLSDWSSTFQFIKAVKELKDSVLISDSDGKGTMIYINLLGDATYLNLKANGWVQGNRRRKIKSITLWVINEAQNDLKHHIHISKGVMIKHSHKHNIEGEKKHQRRFSVRCVKDGTI